MNGKALMKGNKDGSYVVYFRRKLMVDSAACSRVSVNLHGWGRLWL